MDEAQQAGKMVLEFHRESRNFLRGLSEQLGEKTPPKCPKIREFWEEIWEVKGVFYIFSSLQSVPEAAGIPRAEAAGAEAPEGAARRGGTIKKGKSQNLPIFPQNVPGFFFKAALPGLAVRSGDWLVWVSIRVIANRRVERV